jgi:serine/threonine-protein kinase
MHPPKLCCTIDVVGAPTVQEGLSSSRYTILGRLAEGGMADIFLARATAEAGFERYVVLKRVIAERARDLDFARMFLDEARLAAQLSHPNIAPVYDIGKFAGSYFFTMEYVHGEDVRYVRQRLNVLKREWPVNHVLFIVSGVLAALDYAHRKTSSEGKPLGIVHRDVSPSNVMIAYEGTVKLLDFGVAKARERTTESRSGTIKGKIAYLSPEQCLNTAVDRRSDIFSLGIVMYEMLTGVRLYKRDSDFVTMTAITTEAILPPRHHCPSLSPELDAIVTKALAKAPADRFQTAAEMLEAIETLAHDERHVLSANATARFMRELFGERPEPWIELRMRNHEDRAVTVTSESLAGGDDHDALVPTTIGPPPFNVSELESQNEVESHLEAAPALWHRPSVESAPVIALPPPVTVEPQAIAVAPPPPVTAASDIASAATQPALPAPMPVPVAAPARVPMPAPTPVRRRSPRALRIGIAAVLVAGVGIAIAMSFGPSSSSSPEPGSAVATAAPERADAAVVAVAPVAIDAAPVQPAPVEAAPVQPAPVEVAPVPVPPDAAPSPPPQVARPAPPPPPPSIAAAASRDDWSTVRTLCAAARPTAASDRASCGIAACAARQRAVALSYFQQVGRSGQTAIERACSEHGVALTATAHPTAPKPDPCDLDPLKCQR